MSKAAFARYEILLRRFGNVQSFISNLQKTDKLQPWNRDVLGCILIRLRTNFAHLAKAHERPYDSEYIAWAARNLLELAIWSVYATASKENARRLHSDQMVDLAEMLKSMLGLLGKYVPNHPELPTLQEQGASSPCLNRPIFELATEPSVTAALARPTKPSGISRVRG